MRDIDTVEVAKLARKSLANRWPNIKFSVRSSRYSGGSSIDVSWTDGPTSRQVEAIVGHLHGASFDAMQDLKEYNGRPYANDYIFCQRKFSDAFQNEVMDGVLAKYGGFASRPVFKPTTTERGFTSGGYFVETWGVVSSGGIRLDDMFQRALSCTPAAGFEVGSLEGDYFHDEHNLRFNRQQTDSWREAMASAYDAGMSDSKDNKPADPQRGKGFENCYTQGYQHIEANKLRPATL